MKRKSKASKFATIHWVGLGVLVVFGTLVWFVMQSSSGPEPKASFPINAPALPATTANTAAAATAPSVVAGPANMKTAGRLPVSTFSWFRLHPFNMSKVDGAFAWTAEDGKATNIIRLLAHNELEYQRMVIENGTIYRRQLVYHPEGFTLQAQQALQSGQSIQQLTLPGLDGQELPVNVTKTDFESGGDKGVFYGKLPGDPDSMVTVAFINGWESFTVISKLNQIFLHAEAREPGEIVVKQINPSTYGTGVCGNQ
jgi:hypothetical protein